MAIFLRIRACAGEKSSGWYPDPLGRSPAKLPMKISLLYELQISDPEVDAESQLLAQVREQVELADKLGFHAVWAVEHHGLYQYSHCSAPEVLLGYLAGRTRDIRLGHGVTLLPHRYNHPVRVAERIATLDLLSEGRVNFGTGKSASLTEQNLFEVDRVSLENEWEESLRMILGMWQTEVFQYQSERFRISPTRVLPKPAQLPHPPLYRACTTPAAIERAGELGLGVLNFAIGTDQDVKGKVDLYRATASRNNPIGAFATHHFACAPPALVLTDDRKACEFGYRGARFFADGLSHYYESRATPSLSPMLRKDFLPKEKLDDQIQRRDQRRDGYNVLCGDAVFAREYVSRFQELGVDELLLVMQMGTVPPELVLESIRVVGEQVIPHCRYS